LPESATTNQASSVPVERASITVTADGQWNCPGAAPCDPTCRTTVPSRTRHKAKRWFEVSATTATGPSGAAASNTARPQGCCNCRGPEPYPSHHRVVYHTSKHYHTVAVVLKNQHLTRLRHNNGLHGLSQYAGGTVQTSKRSAVTGIRNNHTMAVAYEQMHLVWSQSQAAQDIKLPEAGPLWSTGKYKLPRDRLYNKDVDAQKMMTYNVATDPE
jgi:hypothetical protein